MNDLTNNNQADEKQERYFSDWVYDRAQRNLKGRERVPDFLYILIGVGFYFFYNFIIIYFNLSMNKFNYNFYLWVFIVIMSMCSFIYTWKKLGHYKIRVNEYQYLRPVLTMEAKNIYGKTLKGCTITTPMWFLVFFQIVGLLIIIFGNADFGQIGDEKIRKFMIFYLLFVLSVIQEAFLIKVFFIKYGESR